MKLSFGDPRNGESSRIRDLFVSKKARENFALGSKAWFDFRYSVSESSNASFDMLKVGNSSDFVKIFPSQSSFTIRLYSGEPCCIDCA